MPLKIALLIVEDSVSNGISAPLLGSQSISIVNPYIISLPQMFLDYIFAFGALGLSGIFANSKNGLVKGYIAGIAGRFFFSFLSGWIFFAVYTPEFFNSAVLYSLAYNAAYIGAEGIITIIVIMLPPVKKAILYVKQTSNE